MLLKKFKTEKKQKASFSIVEDKELEKVVGSGNEGIHSIPPEVFEAMFIQPTKMK